MMVYELDDIERGVLMGQTMTEHDRIRKERAESCDRGDPESLREAIVGLQSTDHPDLVALHDELQEQLRQRTFDERRREQGFKSQEHLDAFYRYYDHTQSCEECQQPGEGMVLEDNSIQPTQRRCAVARELDAASDGARFTDGPGDTTLASEGEWRYEFRPDENYPDLGIYTILAPNPDAGKEGVVYSGEDLAMAQTDDEDVAGAIVHEHNAHRKLINALEILRSTLRPVLRDHEVRGNVDRTEGYVLVALNQIDAALALAEAQP